MDIELKRDHEGFEVVGEVKDKEGKAIAFVVPSCVYPNQVPASNDYVFSEDQLRILKRIKQEDDDKLF